MDSHTFINYFDYFIPDSFLTVEEVLSQINPDLFGPIENKDDFFKSFRQESKLDKIAVFDESDNLPDLAAEMMNKMLNKTGINPSDIGYLVCGNNLLIDYNNVSIAHYLHKKFSLENAVIMPIFQPCTASLLGMGHFSSLMDSRHTSYILYLTACKPANIQDRYLGFTLEGDGLALALYSKNPGELEITGWNAFSDGSVSYNKIKNIPAEQTLFSMRMKIVHNGADFIKKTLEKNNLILKDLEIIIPPNTHSGVFSNLYCDLLGVNPELFYLENIPKGGHANDVDLFRNLKDYLSVNEEKKLKRFIMLFSLDLERSYDINYHALLVKK